MIRASSQRWSAVLAYPQRWSAVLAYPRVMIGWMIRGNPPTIRARRSAR